LSSMASSIFRFLFFLLLLSPLNILAAEVPQTLHHTNLLRSIDLTKPYVRDITNLILENIGKRIETDYYVGIPLELAPKLSYLEVKEKKSGASPLFPVELLHEHNS
jgi:Ribophorin I